MGLEKATGTSLTCVRIPMVQGFGWGLRGHAHGYKRLKLGSFRDGGGVRDWALARSWREELPSRGSSEAKGAH